MYHINGELLGTSEILFNSPGSVIPGEKGKAPSKMTINELRERALERLHIDDNGIYLPDGALTGALFSGANFAGLKDGKRALSTLLKAIVFVQGILYFSEENGGWKHEPDFIHEAWGRVPPRTGAMVVIRRPAFHQDWKLPFRLTVAYDRISDGDIRQALDAAGTLVGLGAWRPRLGRFEVSAWQKTA